MKPSESRLNSRITPMTGVPFGPGGRRMVLDLLPAAITRASSLIEGFDFIEDLFQEVSINSRFAVRDNDRADGLLIELDRTSSADDSIDVTEAPQAPERFQQQCLANPATSLAFRNTG